MSPSSNDRVKPQVLEADEDAFQSLKTLSGYQPANPAYTVAILNSQYDAQRAAQQAELAAQNALAAARDAAAAAEWDFHNAMLGVKAQVIAQYGPNSDEVAALGLKKKSERKPPARRQPPA
jgi:hypothetical protein